jgi:hypothetical protein
MAKAIPKLQRSTMNSDLMDVTLLPEDSREDPANPTHPNADRESVVDPDAKISPADMAELDPRERITTNTFLRTLTTVSTQNMAIIAQSSAIVARNNAIVAQNNAIIGLAHRTMDGMASPAGRGQFIPADLAAVRPQDRLAATAFDQAASLVRANQDRMHEQALRIVELAEGFYKVLTSPAPGSKRPVDEMDMEDTRPPPRKKSRRHRN